jgi:hypothetical protein
MGSDFEDSDGEEEIEKPEEDSWDRSSSEEEEDEYGSEENQSQLERFEAGENTATISP